MRDTSPALGLSKFILCSETSSFRGKTSTLLQRPREWNGSSPTSGRLSKHQGVAVAVSGRAPHSPQLPSMLLHLERVCLEWGEHSPSY